MVSSGTSWWWTARSSAAGGARWARPCRWCCTSRCRCRRASTSWSDGRRSASADSSDFRCGCVAAGSEGRPSDPAATHPHRKSEESAEALRRPSDQLVLARRQRHLEVQHHLHGLAQRAPPAADDLAVHHHDVPDETIHLVARSGGEQLLSDRRSIAEADDVLVVVREQMRQATG